jgi:hypothetical protein
MYSSRTGGSGRKSDQAPTNRCVYFRLWSLDILYLVWGPLLIHWVDEAGRRRQQKSHWCQLSCNQPCYTDDSPALYVNEDMASLAGLERADGAERLWHQKLSNESWQRPSRRQVLVIRAVSMPAPSGECIKIRTVGPRSSQLRVATI